MSNAWPQWATLRAEQVTELPPDQQGPWAYGSAPCLISKGGEHQTEPPYFFHCTQHLEEVRQRFTQTTPWPTRDQGFCTGCGRPAVRRPITMNHRVACLQAERTNNTVARLNTRAYCETCATKNGTLCRGTECRRSERKNTVQGSGCCPVTTSGYRRHCSVCCTAAQQRKLQRENRSLGNKAGTNSGIARRRTRDERRRQVAQLRREGLSTQQIADQLSAPRRTVERDISVLQNMTRAAANARIQRLAERKETISQLRDQGLTPHEIAEQTSITVKTVRGYLEQKDRPTQ